MAAAEAARVCREVEGMSSLSMLGVLANQHKGTPANCIATRLAELQRTEGAKAAEASSGLNTAGQERKRAKDTDHLPEEIVIRALLKQRLQSHPVDRHGSLSWLRLVLRNPSQPRFGP